MSKNGPAEFRANKCILIIAKAESDFLYDEIHQVFVSVPYVSGLKLKKKVVCLIANGRIIEGGVPTYPTDMLPRRAMVVFVHTGFMYAIG
jgi:hypothetical protein